MKVKEQLRDEVMKVAKGYATGLYVWGPPGLGKTHNIITTLNQNDIDYKLLKGDITPKGLFNIVYENCNNVIVLDDNININDSKIRKLLLPMLERPVNENSNVRHISWMTNRGEEKIVFTGGIILVNNYPLTKDQHGTAISSRVSVVHYNLSYSEVIQEVKSIISNGYLNLGYEEIQPIANYYSNKHKEMQQMFDIRRFLDKVLPHAQAHKEGVINTTPFQYIDDIVGN